MRRSLICILALLLATAASAQMTDKDKLARALDYFQGNKWHEALLLLEPLDKEYDLNARYRAYMGICYYHEWQYDKATQYLDSVMADVVVYSPQERSSYYYADAESHFQLGQYARAIPLYRLNLQVCQPNEQGEQHFKIAMAHLQLQQYAEALDEFLLSQDCYLAHPVPESKARLAQIKHMATGIRRQLSNGKDTTPKV